MTTDIDKLDATLARLRESEPSIADDGFTAAVMTRLPRANALPTWISNTIMLGATAMGSAIVAWRIPLPPADVVLEVATANLPALLIAAVALTYSTAAGALLTANRL